LSVWKESLQFWWCAACPRGGHFDEKDLTISMGKPEKDEKNYLP